MREREHTLGEAGRRTGLTVGSAVRQWTAALASVGVDSAGADVRRLLAAVIEAPMARLLSEPERVLSSAEAATLAAYVARRSTREPVSRILGGRDFYGRSFMITPATLDPRPD